MANTLIEFTTMAIGKAGAKNAALFAIQILGIKDPIITSALKDHRKKMTSEVLKKAKKVERS